MHLRSDLYQVGLQAGVSYLNRLKNTTSENEFDMKNSSKSMLHELIHKYGESDGKWICIAMKTSLQLHQDIRCRKRSLRLPFSLNEASFVQELREGAAVHSLRRFAFLARLTKVISNAIDHVLAGKICIFL